MGAMSTFTTENYPRKPCILLFLLLVRNCFIFEVEPFASCTDNAKYGVRSMKWFTSNRILIYLTYLVFPIYHLISCNVNSNEYELFPNLIPGHFGVFRSTKQTTNYSCFETKSQQPSTFNSTNMFLIPGLPLSLYKQFVDKGYKKMLPFSKFKKSVN